MNRTDLVTRLAPLALALALAGCGGFNGAEQAYDGPSQSHPITVTADTQTLNVSAPRAKDGLTDAERKEVANFADAYKAYGHGPLAVATPSGSSNTTSAMNVLVEVRDVLNEKGVPTDKISYAPYQASSADSEAPLILSFRRYVAKASPCGDWSTNYADDPSNGVPPNFGCASQNNLAAMIADPADLVTPRTMTPADAQRRAVVFGKYRNGDITATTRNADDSAAVSEVNK